MSYRDRFRHSHDGYAQQQFWINFENPDTIYELKRIQQRDQFVARDIETIESLLADLKEYRQDLARRYSELATMTYTYKLYLIRDKSWSTKKVSYTVRLVRVFPDGTEVADQTEVFSGTERKQAFELFAKLKKERPGIEAVQDTQKKRWET